MRCVAPTTLVVCALLSLCAGVATSIYFNVPAVWNPPAARRAERLYNPHPPIAYRLVRSDGPLRRTAAWCHALAALLALAAWRAPQRGRAPDVPRPADSRYRACLRALVVFHTLTWILLAGASGAVGAAPALLASSLAGYVYAQSRRGRGSARCFVRPMPIPHVLPLLSLGLALSIAAGLIHGLSSSAVVRDRVVEVPSLAPRYAAQWAALLGALALLAGLLLRLRPSIITDQADVSLVTIAGSVVVATALVAGTDWYCQPPPNFGEAVPGVLYHSGQPGEPSLGLAHQRFGFRTIVYVHPDTSTAAHARELRFAHRHGLRLIDAIDEAFRPEDLLRLTRDPSARPVLLHCIEGRNRTPAWLAVYRIVEQGWSPPQAFAEMERISGRRLKSYAMDWVEKAAARLEDPEPIATAQSQQNDESLR